MADPIINFKVRADAGDLEKMVRDVTGRMRQIDRAFNKLNPQGLNNIAKTMRPIARGFDDIKTASERAAGSINDLGSKAKLTAQRFIVYNIIAGFFFRLADAIRVGIASFVDFDAQMNKAQQILNPLTSDFKALQQSVFDLGAEFGVTVKEVQAAQETFLRQGLTQQKAIDLTRASLALATAGAYDFAESTEALTSILAQFNFSASEATRITDKLVEVSVRYAAEVGDIDQGLRRAGFAAKTAGVNFDELVGFITAAQEATRRGGEVIGTSLRTIFTRLFRAPSIDLLKSLGIETRKATGEFRDGSAIIGDLAERFKQLDNTQKLAIASTIAGQRQISTFLAILEKYDRAQQATATSINATGSAEEKSRKRLESLTAQLNIITNQFIAFGVAVGKAISPDVISFIQAFSSGFEKIGGVVGSVNAGVLESLLGTLTKLAVLWGLQSIGLGRFQVRLTKLNDSWVRLNQGATQYEKTQQRINTIIKKQEAKGTLGRTGGINQLVEAQKTLNAANAELTSQQNTLLSYQLSLETLITEQATLELQTKQLMIKLTGEQAVQEKTVLEIQKELIKLQTQGLIIQSKISNIKASDYRLQLEDQLIGKLNEELRILQEQDTIGTKSAKERLQIGKQIVDLNKQIKKNADDIAAAEKGRFAGQKERLGQLTEERQALLGERRRKVSSLREITGKAEVDQSAKMLRIQLRIANIEEQRERRLQRVATLEKELADLQLTTNQNIAAIEKRQIDAAEKQALIELEIEASAARQVNLFNRISAERADLVGIESALARSLERQKQASKEFEEARSKASQSFIANSKGLGVAFAASIGLDAVGQLFDNLGEDGSQAFRTLGTVARETGSIVSTALIAGTGPIGLVLIGLQAIVATFRLIKQAGEEASRALERTTKEGDLLNNTIRATNDAFNSFLEIARKTDISLEDLSSIEAEFAQIEKSAGLAANTLGLFRSQVTEAVSKGDIDRINSLQKEIQKTILQKRVQGGEILSTRSFDDANELIERTAEKIGLVQKRRNEFLAKTQQQRGKGFSFELDEEDITERLEKFDAEIRQLQEDAKPAGEAMQKFGAQLLEAFPQLVDPTKNLSQNLHDIKPGLSTMAKIAGVTAVAFKQLALAQGAVLSTSVADIVAKQTEEERDLFAQLSEATKRANGDIRAVIPALNTLTAEQENAVEVGIKFNQGFLDTNKANEMINILARLGKVTDEQLRGKLVEGFRKGRDGAILTKLATGDYALTLEATGQTIVLTDREFQALTISMKNNATIAGVNLETFRALSKAMLANSIIAKSFTARLQQLGQEISASAELTQSYQASISKLVSINNELAQSFPERIFTAPLQGLTSLIDRAGVASQASTNLLSAWESVQQVGEDLTRVIDDKLTQSLADGGDAAALYTARIDAIASAQSQLQQRASRLDRTLYEAAKAQRGNKLGFNSEQLAETTLAAVQVQKLRLALAALAAERDRILASKESLFEKDRENLKRLAGEVQRQLGSDEQRIELPIDLSSISKEDAIRRIDNYISSIGSDVMSIENPTFRKMAADFAETIGQVINPTTSESGDTKLKPITDALLTQTDTVGEEMAKVLQEIESNLINLAKTAKDSFEFVLSTATNSLDQMAKAVQQRKFLPDFNSREARQNILGLFTSIRSAAAGQLKDVTEQLNNVELTITGLRAEQARLKDDTGQIAQNNMEEFANITERINNLLELRKKLTIDVQTGIESLNLDAAKFVQLAEAGISAVITSQKELFNAQNELTSNEINNIRKRLELNQEEVNTSERKIALARLEGSLTEAAIRNIQGIGDIDPDQLATDIADISSKLINAGVDGLNSAQEQQLQLELQTKQQQFSAIKQISDIRIEALNKELNIINEQVNAVRGLADEFLKANKEQQAKQIEAARLTDVFFGNLTQGMLDSPQADSAIQGFLRNATDEQRAAVIGQLERLRGVGDVAPGVSAQDVLTKIQDAVGSALFSDPQINLLEEQKRIQNDMLITLVNANKLAELQVRIANSQVSASNNVAKSIVAIGRDPRASVQINAAAQELEQGTLAATTKELNDIQTARIQIEQRMEKAANQATVSNKNFVRSTESIDLASVGAAESNDALQKKLVELRDAFITADDKLADAQKNFQNALGNVAAAIGAAGKAQADYILGIKEAERANLSAIGGFVTFRDELAFLNDAYNQQISILQQVGAKESEISDLRARLAQEQLQIFEQQINAFKDQALNLFTGDLRPTTVAQQAAAAQTVGGIVAGGGSLQDIFNQLAALPEDFRRQALEGLNLAKAIPGQTVAGLSPEEIINQIAAAFGGATSPENALLALQQEAATQRQIIAENSISQLESTRQSVIAAYEQLATAQEGLMEAKAQRDLLQMQIDAAQQGFQSVTSIMEVVADNLSGIGSKLDTLVGGFGSVTSGTATQLLGAAKGTLTSNEMAGLYAAAIREKRAMPAGSRLGVFNTSESVLTRRQMTALRAGYGIPNAANGFGAGGSVDTNRIIEALADIGRRIDNMNVDNATKTINLEVASRRTVDVQGTAGIQTALQDIISDRTSGLFSREEGRAIQMFVEGLINKLRTQGLKLDANLTGGR